MRDRPVRSRVEWFALLLQAVLLLLTGVALVMQMISWAPEAEARALRSSGVMAFVALVGWVGVLVRDHRAGLGWVGLLFSGLALASAAV